jgi:hypothetical protein
VLAVVLMMSSAIYQRRTGPTYPMRGTLELSGVTYDYRLIRSHDATYDARVAIPRGGSGTAGRLFYKRYPTADPFTAVPMEVEGDQLVGRLPAQPPAGKLEYYVRLD